MTNHLRRPIDPKLLHLCRVLRANATDAENLLWRLLRNRQLGGLKFRRQYPAGGFILDFYCHEGHLGIELDGGGHAEAGQANHDLRRTQALAQQGIRVLRFWNHQVLDETEAVIRMIWEAATSSEQT